MKVLGAISSILFSALIPVYVHALPGDGAGSGHAFVPSPTPRPPMLDGATNTDQITIQDSGGFTRAASSVETTGKVEFTLVDSAGLPADGVPVTLTNSATGQTIVIDSAAGTATFDSLAPGVWTVSTTTPGVTFTNVAIVNALAASGVAAGLGTTALVVGGTGAAAGTAVAIADATEGNPSDLSPAS